MYDYNLAWGLQFRCRFDDRGFVSRAQIWQKYKLKIVLFDWHEKCVCNDQCQAPSYLSHVFTMEVIDIFPHLIKKLHVNVS